MKIYESRSARPIVDWQWLEPSLRNITHLCMKHVPPGESENGRRRALDVGGGTGRMAFALAERGYDVEVVDIEPRAVELGRALCTERGASCRFRVADYRDPSEVLPNHYDLIVCSEVLEHVEDYPPIVANIHTALKPGGRLIVSVPYDMKKLSVLDIYGGHVRRFDAGQIERDLAAFQLRKVTVTGFPFYRLMMRTYLLLNRAGGGEHSNESLWSRPSTRLIAKLVYPFMRADNLFAFTRLGDALIAVADKV